MCFLCWKGALSRIMCFACLINASCNLPPPCSSALREKEPQASLFRTDAMPQVL